jgi:hypothetical protein
MLQLLSMEIPMKRLLAAILLAMASLGATLPALAQAGDLNDMSVDELIQSAPAQHPAALYVLAARLLRDGRGQEAANWMYAGQLRYRFLILASDAGPQSDERILFSALTEQVGRPVNEYIGGNVDEWIAAIDWALAWDAAHDNAVTSKADHADKLAELRAGLVEFRDSLDGQRVEIARQREQNGLPNR